MAKEEQYSRDAWLEKIISSSEGKEPEEADSLLWNGFEEYKTFLKNGSGLDVETCMDDIAYVVNELSKLCKELGI